MIEHRAFFGDGEKTFALTEPMIHELQRTTGNGIGKLFGRINTHDFTLQEIAETIRLGLIGGGTTPAEAAALVATYVHGRPLMEGMELAFVILNVRFFGNGVGDGAAQDTATEEPMQSIDPAAVLKVETLPDGRTMAHFE